MKIKVFGSSSRGNCYLIQGIEEDLLLEAGLPFPSIQAHLDYDFHRIVGCVVSHNHKDHAKGAAELSRRGIPIYCKKYTLDSCKIEGHNAIALTPEKECKIGREFLILPFDVQHDVPSLGYLIQNTVTHETIMFATDTYYVKYLFDKVDCYMIEANYDMEIVFDRVSKGEYNHEYSMRLRESHFEILNVIQFLRETDLKRTKKILLVHLSHDNANPEDFVRRVRNATGIPTLIAVEGLEFTI